MNSNLKPFKENTPFYLLLLPFYHILDKKGGVFLKKSKFLKIIGITLAVILLFYVIIFWLYNTTTVSF